MTLIIGDNRKGRYDPDLARRLNEQFEKNPEELEKKVEEVKEDKKIFPTSAICAVYEDHMKNYIVSDILDERISQIKPTSQDVTGFVEYFLPEYGKRTGEIKVLETKNHIKIMLVIL